MGGGGASLRGACSKYAANGSALAAVTAMLEEAVAAMLEEAATAVAGSDSGADESAVSDSLELGLPKRRRSTSSRR